MWQSLAEWVQVVSTQYGVDPFIFVCIYVGTIPGLAVSLGWTLRRMLRGRSLLVPAALAAGFYASSYLYVLLAGRNLPGWAYGGLVLLLGAGAWLTARRLRQRTGGDRGGASDQKNGNENNGAPDYDVLVIGGGAGGLTAAGVAAAAGARTLLVDRHRLGGDCTWTGCIPSKTLLKSARVAHQMRTAARYGLTDQAPHVDFARVMEHVRATRRRVYEEADAPERLESFGIEVRRAEARFVGPRAVALRLEDGAEHVVRARRVILATGGRPHVPPTIDGLEAAPYLTSETLFELTEQPARLAILGAGPIGIEMAQAFQRLGTQVTVIDQNERILAHDHPALAGTLQHVLAEEGVRFRLGADVQHVRSDEGSSITLYLSDKNGTDEHVTADALLVATGRRPNVEGLGLEAAGIDYAARGVTVDARCRTSQAGVWAVGDVTGRYQFTHMSDHMARVAAQNAVLKLPKKIDAAHVPWVTYTDPELAHVGATEAALQEQGTAYRTYRFPYEKLDRAVAEHETTGEIRVYATRWRGKILGVSILGARAGELIGAYALAMRQGVTLRQIADTIHPYPTWGLGVRRAADQWYAEKQTPTLVRALQTVFGYRGPVPAPDPNRVV